MNTPDQTMILILGEIKGTVAEVKEAIRELKETVANNNAMHNSRIDDIEEKHHNRISKLESIRDKAVGWVIGAGAVFGMIFHLIPKAIASVFGVHP